MTLQIVAPQALALCLCTLLTGCASLLTTVGGAELQVDKGSVLEVKKSKVYAGTKVDAFLLGRPFVDGVKGEDGGAFLLLYPFILIDLPLSMVMDTLLLPYTLSTSPRDPAGGQP